MKTVIEPSRQIPVAADFDVIVAGGGVAGCAAALAAAQEGCKVALLERMFALGGLATLGNISIYLPICDGYGTQVIGGLGETLLKLSCRDIAGSNPELRFEPIPEVWREPERFSRSERAQARYRCQFNPASFMLALEEILLDAGVEIFYDTRLVSVQRSNEELSHVIVENKSGRLALAGRAFVDATGDADLCFLAGEATHNLDGNVVAGWHYWSINGKLHQAVLSKPYAKDGRPRDNDGPFFRGDDGRSVSSQV
ncbi:MAG: FAD-dependent oxidoreductase, partial [Lentisphaerae bacterium]